MEAWSHRAYDFILGSMSPRICWVLNLQVAICEKNMGSNLTHENKELIEKISKTFEVMHGEMELEIDKTVKLATELVWWRD